MNKLRKGLALLLCLAVCLTLMPAAFAEEPTGDCLVWEGAPAANEAAPVIETQPAGVSVTEGETATFIVQASGTNLQYQWQFMAPGATAWLSAASTTATLSFTATPDQDSYAYRCIVSNGGGSVTSDIALLSVSAGAVTAPSITIQPNNTTVAEGATASFTVTASGSNLKYQWQYRRNSSASWTNCTDASATTKTFNVKGRASLNGYQYHCIVSNVAGSAESDAVTLTVNSSAVSKPVITEQPTNFSAAVGAKGSVTVTATGSNLKYQWQYRRNSSAPWTNCTDASAKTKTFTVTGRASLNGYQYHCVISNAGGSVTSNTVTLTVTGGSVKPSITTQPNSVTVAEGAQASFTVTATGTGLSYQWQYRKNSSAAWTNCTDASGKTKTFNVKGRASLNGYQYHCVVSNTAGSVTTNAVTLTVVKKPTITTQPSSVIAADGTTATFTVSASGTDLQYQWQYRASASGAWMDTTEAGGKTNTYTVNASAEIGGYQYRCRVYNSAGEVYSDVVTLNIQLDPPAITSATVRGTIVTLEWSAVPAASSYAVYMAKSGDTLEEHESGITATSLTISGLEKNTSYSFAVAALSDCCNAMSATVTVTTGDSDGVTTYRALLIGEENFSPVCTRNRGDVELMSSMLSSVKGPSGGKYYISTRFDVNNSAIHSAIISTFSGADSDDVSLFFIATHGVTDVADGTNAGALATLVSGGPSTELLPLETLASWLGGVKGKVIVILGSCGSGAAVYQGPDSENSIVANAAANAGLDAFNEEVVRAFEAEDRLVLSGEHTYFFNENGSGATLQFNLGDFCTSKFYVLTAARHQESSWGWESTDNPSQSRNVFTDALVNGVMNTMPADTETGDGDGVVNLHELFLYIKAHATDVSPSQGYYQHVQEYPKNSSYKLFKK